MTTPPKPTDIPDNLRNAVAAPQLRALDISLWGFRPSPEPSWIFHHLVARGEVGLLAGRSNVGKGMASLQMAVMVALGWPVFGRNGDNTPRHAFVIQMEDSPEELERRIARLLEVLRQDPEWSDQVEARLHKYLHILVPDWQVGGSKALSALIPELEGQVKAIHKAGDEIGLFVLDTLAALTEGDENAVEALRSLWPSCFKLRDLSGSAVVCIHHLRKGPPNTKAPAMLDRLSFESLRGSTAITAGARFILQLEPLTPAEAERLELDDDKATRGGYAVLGSTKVVSGPKGDMLLLEQYEGCGGGFWGLHPRSDNLCALLRSSNAAVKLSQDQAVLLSLADGMTDRKELMQEHWKNEPAKVASAKLKAVMNRLRNRHSWVQRAPSLDLTVQGAQAVRSLREGDAPSGHRTDNPASDGAGYSPDDETHF